FIGRSVLDFVSGDDREAVKYMLQNPAEREVRLLARRSDGSEFPVEVRAGSLPTEGGVERRVVRIRDISDKLKLEDIKDEFLTTVRHELRTPVTSIRGAIGLLERENVLLDAEKARRMLELARNNTERLVRLTNDILDLSALNPGRCHCRCGHAPLSIW